jgi:hypothetical protein
MALRCIETRGWFAIEHICGLQNVQERAWLFKEEINEGPGVLYQAL